MVEKNLIINNREITYKGVFKVRDIFNVINEGLTTLKYQKQEKKTEEIVTAEGKKTHLELRPFKIKSNFMTLMLKIRIDFDKVTEITKKVDNLPKKFQQGDISIRFDAWSITDYGSRWGMKPWFYFLKGVINKYFYRYHLDSDFIGELAGDVDYLGRQIKALLSLYKYQVVHQPEKPGPKETTTEPAPADPTE
tara:strand:+ start:260 stop:838 length:579 start_codon:yes stop_codon:yes gene_type:complete